MGMVEQFKASMLLSGVGDALGYKNGSFEFNFSGPAIHKEVKEMGGVEGITTLGWKVSDDTVMHIATAKALLSKAENREKLYSNFALEYKMCMRDMAGRAPGITCQSSCSALNPRREKGYQIPYNPRGGGCGAAMRAMCIGLRYYRPEDLQQLIEVSVESGRMTHHHPTGYLGSMAAALLTSYAVQRKPMGEWGRCILGAVPIAMRYISQAGHCEKENRGQEEYFVTKWQDYLKLRGLLDGVDPIFPEEYGVRERDVFYKSMSFSGFAGASGHDSTIIAYDALLASKSWTELCERAMFHGGDSDSTGVIAGACWGALNGLNMVPKSHYEHLEYGDKLLRLGESLWEATCPEK